MELKKGDVIEGYEIIDTIGKGAMSRVYLGKKNNTCYAIKETLSEFSSEEEKNLFLNAFNRERELLYTINHPGIPHFYRNFKHNDNFYIVMEYIKGKSLEDIIKGSVKPPDEKRALNWAIQICEILFYLHTLSPEPVIYRDLKPSNIIITEGDRVKLIDFGVARRYDPHKDCDTVRLGTPGYAAPEQCRAKGQSIPQSDIYALGVALHQLLTLYDPSISPFKLPPIRKLNHEVSEQLEWIINKAINLDSRDRYLDTGLFRDELLDYYEENFGSFTFTYKREIFCTGEKNTPFNGGPSLTLNNYKPAAIIFIIMIIFYFLFSIPYNCLRHGSIIKKPHSEYMANPPTCNKCPEYNKKSQKIPEEKEIIEEASDPFKPGMVFVEGGTFEMGSNNGRTWERPVHTVEVDSFYMGKYEVTNKEYCAYDQGHDNPGDKLPVVEVSWNEVAAYCNWLSTKEGLSPCYTGEGDNIEVDMTKNGYRLPTEAEWEYACRAGSTTEYYWGDVVDGSYCWYSGNGKDKPHEVGKKKPNSLGLYDMSGNVFEWCNDWYSGPDFSQPPYYSISQKKNPPGPSSGTHKAERGGSYNGGPIICRSATRYCFVPGGCASDLGFRLVRSP